MLWYGALLYFTYLMVLITVQYVPIDINAAFLNVKSNVNQLLHYQIAFFSHVYTSIFVLILGIIQFSKTSRNKYPKAHRTIGKIYVLLILFISSPSGLVMAYYANGGWLSQLSFILQAVLWFGFTFFAFRFAKQKNWAKHHKFMMYSYALTLSAISLRLFKWGIVSTLEWPPMDTYKIVAWLGWTFNLLVVELIWLFLPKK